MASLKRGHGVKGMLRFIVKNDVFYRWRKPCTLWTWFWSEFADSKVVGLVRYRRGGELRYKELIAPGRMD